MKQLIVGLFYLYAAYGFSQQAFRVDFRFKLIDGGKTIEYADFCKSFQILGEEDRKNVTPCDDKSVKTKDFYRSKTKLYNAGGSVLYEDLVRKFIKDKDTMVLVLETGLDKTLSFQIDELEIKPGKFSVKEPKLAKIDFDKAEENYYNYILRKFKSLGELTDKFEGSFFYKELNRLRDFYLVPGDDYEEKDIEKLRSYKKKVKKRKG